MYTFFFVKLDITHQLSFTCIHLCPQSPSISTFYSSSADLPLPAKLLSDPSLTFNTHPCPQTPTRSPGPFNFLSKVLINFPTQTCRSGPPHLSSASKDPLCVLVQFCAPVPLLSVPTTMARRPLWSHQHPPPPPSLVPTKLLALP